MVNKKSDVEKFLSDKNIIIKTRSLEISSKIFSSKDNLSVHSMEAIFAMESGFGNPNYFGERGSGRATGFFQQKKMTAERYGLIVNDKNDQRFDLGKASIAASKQLKNLDNIFSKIRI